MNLECNWTTDSDSTNLSIICREDEKDQLKNSASLCTDLWSRNLIPAEGEAGTRAVWLAGNEQGAFQARSGQEHVQAGFGQEAFRAGCGQGPFRVGSVQVTFQARSGQGHVQAMGGQGPFRVGSGQVTLQAGCGQGPFLAECELVLRRSLAQRNRGRPRRRRGVAGAA
ncbi:hypothetical protein E2C01_083391 [Portunus trituberculatus]|uniref:Uncharacterized protein n=1 Tax=Portunus trituberculatus TaxID=210409 RepID=A0A5B7J3D2_PORTR|nr:hypothetical protein [Portunus trituberculatus]